MDLKRQLEITRLHRAIDIAQSMADRRLLLTTTELSRLNNILTGKDTDPWRKAPVTVTLPSGIMRTLSVLADPQVTTREMIHKTIDRAEQGEVIEAAVDVYSGLVMAHVFEDANRRTAILACHYFLNRYGIPVSGLALYELGLGDLADSSQIDLLRDTIRQIAKFATKK